jgi:hypothetical protein
MLNLKVELADAFTSVVDKILPFGKKEVLRFGLDTGLKIFQKGNELMSSE